MIPQEMVAVGRWVTWKLVRRGDEEAKVPFYINGNPIPKGTPHEEWGGKYTDAVSTQLGFVLGSGWGGVDFDHCRNPETGEIQQWVLDIVARLDSYTEISPSGDGLHIIILGIPEIAGKKKEITSGMFIEMYSKGRYFTVTGNHLPGTPESVNPRPREWEALISEIGGRKIRDLTAEGNRNNDIYDLAHKHLKAGFSIDQTIKALQASTSLPGDEVLRTVESAYQSRTGNSPPIATPLTSSEAQTLFADIEQQITQYVILPSPEALTAIVLWIVHTHLFEEFDTTPYLRIQSAEKQSGKSLLLDVIGPLAANPKETANISYPALFRVIEAEKPTLIFDETDGVFNEHSAVSGRYEELRSILNAGIRKGQQVHRMEGEGAGMKIKAYSVYCPKVLSGLKDLPDTLNDRSIVIRMYRRLTTEPTRDFRFSTAKAEARALNIRIAGWAASIRGTLPTSVSLPDQLSDRAKDLWEPLVIIADKIGGEWSDKIRTAATTLCEQHEDLSIGALLLNDIRSFFVEEELSSKEILSRLNTLSDRPWSTWRRGREMTVWNLSSILRGFGIRTEMTGPEEKRVNRYFRSTFEKIWARYLPAQDKEEEDEEEQKQYEYSGIGF